MNSIWTRTLAAFLFCSIAVTALAMTPQQRAKLNELNDKTKEAGKLYSADKMEEAAKLINEDGVDLMLVASTPETVNPVADQCEAAGVPCISTVPCGG